MESIEPKLGEFGLDWDKAPRGRGAALVTADWWCWAGESMGLLVT